MDIKVAHGNITQVDASAFIVNLFDGVKEPEGGPGAVDTALDDAITHLINDGEIKGKKGEITLTHTLGKITPGRVIVLGLGKSSELDAEVIRETMADTCRYLRKLGVKKATTQVDPLIRTAVRLK